MLGVLNRIYTNKKKINIKGIIDSTFFVTKIGEINFLNNLVYIRTFSFEKPHLTKKVFLEPFKYPEGITCDGQYLYHKFYFFDKKYYGNEKYFARESNKNKLLEW